MHNDHKVVRQEETITDEFRTFHHMSFFAFRCHRYGAIYKQLCAFINIGRYFGIRLL